MTPHLRTFVPLVVALAAGCTAPSPSGSVGPALTDPLVITAAKMSSASRVSFTVSGPLAKQPTELNEPLQSLQLDLWSGDRPRLVELVMPLSDVDVPASALPPSGLKLRNLKLTLVEPAHLDVVHAQADALEVRVTTPLRLDWSWQLDDGKIYPLGPAETRPLAFDIAVVHDGQGGAIATVNAQCDGACWSIDGVASLDDGTLYAEATADLTPQ